MLGDAGPGVADLDRDRRGGFDIRAHDDAAGAVVLGLDGVDGVRDQVDEDLLELA